jgi:hypothetical protein
MTTGLFEAGYRVIRRFGWDAGENQQLIGYSHLRVEMSTQNPAEIGNLGNTKKLRNRKNDV